MPEMLQANTQKVKYTRIRNEISVNTRWNIHEYLIQYPWIRKLFGKRNRKNGRGDEKKRNCPALKNGLINLLR